MGVVTGVALTAAASWAALVVALYLLQRTILFVPDPGRPDPSLGVVPEMVRVQATTEDGLRLEGWWSPPPVGGPTILYFHGNAGNIGSRHGKARRLIDHGYGLLLAGYRGYGGNPGSPSEVGLIDDGRAWMATLESLGVPASSAILYGESLGSGVVAALAAERPVALVVLEAPYTSIVDIAAARYWFAPVRWLVKDPFDTMSRLPKVKAPVLILHGTEDRLIPVAHGERLHEVAIGPKRLVRVQDGNHVDLFDHGAVDELDAFVAELGIRR